MLVQFKASQLELIQGDITRVNADAIVNAANSRLAGGGGVDGAIHQAAGPMIMEETRRLYPEGCPTGSAVATSGGNLNATYIFHAVGPVWRGGMENEPDLLTSAYQRCLELAVENKCQSVPFPAISTGVYGYPYDLAARDSLNAIHQFLLEHEQPAHVMLILFDNGIYGAFARELETLID